MENVINSKIGVSFFLKKMNHKNSVKKRGVYATISYAGTSVKMKTGLICEDPEKQWRRGMFEGKKFSEYNLQLFTIKNKIEAFDVRFCKSAQHIKDLYNGAKVEDIPMTILAVFKESLDRKTNLKKYKVRSSTLTNLKSGVNNFKLWMKVTQRPDFGVVQSHPYKLTNRHIESFYTWNLERVQERTANNIIRVLHNLFEMYHKTHYGNLEGLIRNPFKDIIVEEEEHERVKKALERAICWSWIDKIENLKYKLPKGVVINKVELWDDYWKKKGKHNPDYKAVSKEKYRLLTLILAYSGLSFAELGKADVLTMNTTMSGGKVLSGRRVKTNQKYTIPVTPKLERFINKLGPLPWQPFVDDKRAIYYNGKSSKYMMFTKYIKRSLSKDIGWDEDFTLTPHRLRHTFAMRQLNHFGFSLMVVARMLGDTEQTVRKNYADYNDDSISKTFNKEMERFLKKQKKKGEEGEDLEDLVAV